MSRLPPIGPLDITCVVIVIASVAGVVSYLFDNEKLAKKILKLVLALILICAVAVLIRASTSGH